MDRRQFLGSSSVATLAALLPAAARAAVAGTRDAEINAVYNQIVMARIQRSPEFATSLGFDKGPNAALKHQLSDTSPAAKARNLADTKAAITKIESFAPDSLSEGARLDREVVLYSLHNATLPQDQFQVDSVIRPFPIFQQGGAYFSTPDFLNTSHTIVTQDDAEAYLDRLNAFAGSLDQDTADQKEAAGRGLVAPRFCLELTLAQMAKLRSPAPAANTLTESIVRRTRDKGLAGDWQARAASIVEQKIYPALDRQMALMRDLNAKGRPSAGLWDVPRGQEIYAAALAQATTTDFTPDQVHKMGLEQVAEITATLDALLKQQGLRSGSVGERLTALNARADQLYADTPEGRAALLASLNKGVEDVATLLPKAFLNPNKAPLEIRAVPVEIQDGASNGYYSRAALDGSRPAIYWINLKSVADWPKYSLPALTFHEGLPGHHLQISTAQSAEGPLIRKMGFFGAYTEGWALYAEQLADELGAYHGPLERAGYLQSFLFRAARLVVDTGIHTKKWSRDQATDYLVATTGFPRARSQREVERYCTQPGQACSYKLGHISWTRARAKAQAIAGDKFNLQQFHEVIRLGAMPLTMFERLVEERAKAMV
ncbi:DUF885 domain-containing protein [Sphingomonas sp. HT-1]|uniref:DUF885 domain-containing protein n=1 Tax=unclassified Sphingomonas TaxID=196159 RepID=UPI00030DCFE9|nr:MULTISPECIES: DUF885 family protein [unclassified Sphingomonas]KTF70823.1 Tat pathway signal protein [Sphingomonas sp. WG]